MERTFFNRCYLQLEWEFEGCFFALAVMVCMVVNRLRHNAPSKKFENLGWPFRICRTSEDLEQFGKPLEIAFASTVLVEV